VQEHGRDLVGVFAAAAVGMRKITARELLDEDLVRSHLREQRRNAPAQHTLNIGINGVSANIKLLGGTVDFGGRNSTASVAFTSGTIANATVSPLKTFVRISFSEYTAEPYGKFFEAEE
jgi:hypothetical protein